MKQCKKMYMSSIPFYNTKRSGKIKNKRKGNQEQDKEKTFTTVFNITELKQEEVRENTKMINESNPYEESRKGNGQ